MDMTKIQAVYGLKWNPFSQEIPIQGLHQSERTSSFCYRVESLVIDGGFAMITGDPGVGKSVTLRVLADRLGRLRDLRVGCLARPQSRMTDFYRELGALFEFTGSTSNRWSAFRTLREKWLAHIASTLFRPVLLIDEAQEVPTAVLSELRLLGSMSFDSRQILTVVLCGDGRLPERLRSPELLPLASRIRTRLQVDAAGRDELRAILTTRLAEAGNSALMTDGLIDTLVEHAAGNTRALLALADELFVKAVATELRLMDEKLFFDHYPAPESSKARRSASRAAPATTAGSRSLQ